MTSALLLPSRLSGAVWGHLVGDALGVPYEFRTAAQITDVEWRGGGAHRQPAGTWSDDGALMLALLDSLLDAGFDPDDQARRSLDWFDHGRYAPGALVFDSGIATRTAMAAIRQGVPGVDAGRVEEDACGNGSLMRILPLALVERTVTDERLVEMAHLASRVTHGNPRCQIACALNSLVVRRLLAGDLDRATALLYAQSRLRAIYGDARATVHLGALDELEAWTARSGRGFVLDSFWSAWDAFSGADSYHDAVVRAIRYGQDTDTTAAIAGGLAGSYFGVDDIPAEWRAGLREPSIIRPLVDRLIETDTAHGHWRTSTTSPIRVDEILFGALNDWPGHLGITFLPGKRGTGMAGRHWRDLDADLERLRTWGDTLVVLVEDHELVDAGVTDIPEAAARHDIVLIRFPIPDPHVPHDLVAYRALVQDSAQRIRDGRSVVIVCRGGIDRSGMTAACVLQELGADPKSAIERTQAGRKGSITLPEQQAFVRAWGNG